MHVRALPRAFTPPPPEPKASGVRPQQMQQRIAALQQQEPGATSQTAVYGQGQGTRDAPTTETVTAGTSSTESIGRLLDVFV